MSFMDRVIKVVIADDHQMFIDGVFLLLKEVNGIECVGQAANGKQLLQVLNRVSADVILLDISMPEKDGIETAIELKAKYPDVKILMLTMSIAKETIKQLVELGVQGYILKDSGKEQLAMAIQTVYNGGVYYSQKVTSVLFDKQAKSHTGMEVILTDREKDILKLITSELTTQEIADQLFISQSTVITHRRNLLRKIGARNTAGLVKYALEYMND